MSFFDINVSYNFFFLKQFYLRKVVFFISECDFKYGLFKDCLRNLDANLSQQSTLTSEACI